MIKFIACQKFGKVVSLSSLMIAAAVGFPAPQAYSATLFEFGPSSSYVEGNVDYARTASISGGGPYTSAVAFNSETPLSPSSNYNGPAFYGGYRFSSDTNSVGFASGGQGLFNDYAKAGGNDVIYYNVVGSNNDSFHSTTMSFASVVIFKREAFNAPFRQGAASVGGFSISYYRHANGSVSSWFKPEGRWLVEVGGTYYLSNSTFTGTTNDTYATFTLSGSDLSSTLWAAYDPAADLFFDASSATFSALSLQNVDAVGFYFDEPSFETIIGTVGMRLAVDSFIVTEAIPEPAALGFIGLGVPVLVGAMKLRNRRHSTSK